MLMFYSVTQLQSIVTVTEGEDVALQCNYTVANTGSDYLFWYRHLTNKAPEYILRTSTKNRNKDHADFAKERFSTNVSKAERTVPLNILQVRVTDSAGYYCALSPTVAQISDSTLQKLPCGTL
uniref:Ig-like domain-containing protein n=1 Tax=Callorhinchus milii TaxID=7868 RepID=A0A4W3HCM1_CALMI